MADEPAIIAYGRSVVDAYPIVEYRASLRRAFFVHGADFITLDSNPRGQRFLVASAAWAIDAGLLFCARTDDDGQSEVSAFRLTDKGREELGNA